MGIQKISDLVKCPEFSGLPGRYRRVAACYVAKRRNEHDYVLVGTRDNPHDPLRKGYNVLPCGGLEDGETFEEAAYRETLEETGVYTELGNPSMFSQTCGPYIKEYGPVVTLIDRGGMVWMLARDSNIKLTGKALHLVPFTEPKDMPESDLRNPFYTDFIWLLQNQESVMPEERFMLDMVAERKMIRGIKNKITLDEEDLVGFIREAVNL